MKINKPKYEGSYPRELNYKSDSFSFDPIEISERTVELVCKNGKRKYTDFYTVGVYGGIATAYTVGCNLRCFFFWVGRGRDRPKKYGNFYSSEEVSEKLLGIASNSGVEKARVS